MHINLLKNSIIQKQFKWHSIWKWGVAYLNSGSLENRSNLKHVRGMSYRSLKQFHFLNGNNCSKSTLKTREQCVKCIKCVKCVKCVKNDTGVASPMLCVKYIECVISKWHHWCCSTLHITPSLEYLPAWSSHFV